MTAPEDCVVTVKNNAGAVEATINLTADTAYQAGSSYGNGSALYGTDGPYYFSGTKPFALQAQCDNEQDEEMHYGFRRDLKPRYGTEAVTEILQSSVTDLEGNQEAAIVMRAKAGTGGAQLELVAGDNVSGGSVSTARIDADNIILDGTVTATQIAATTITASEIASGAITTGKIAAGAVTANEIASGTITSNELTVNIRSDIGAGTGNGNGNGNSNLTNNNVSISGSQISSGTVSDSRLANNVSKKGNTGNLFASTTNISGGQINTGIVTGGDLTINSTNYEPNAGNGGFALGIPASGTGAGRFVVGSPTYHLWWNGSELSVQGRIANVTDALLRGEGFPSGSAQEFNTNNQLGGALTGIYGAGIYVAILWGGGGGGGAGTNNADNSGSARGGSSGGMAICAFEYDGTTALNASLGSGGGGAVSNRDYAVAGNGGASNLTLGNTVIMTANGGSRGGGTNNSRPGGTGAVNIANNNALFSSSNTNTSKGSATNNNVSAGAGVVVPTIESEDANLTAQPGSFNGGAAGGSIIGNQAGGNNNSNGNILYNSNYVSGYTGYPQVGGSVVGLGGQGHEAPGSANLAGAGGRFAGGGAYRSVFGSSNSTRTGGAGNRGGGGGGCRSGRNNNNPSTVGGAGGAGGLILMRL